MKQRKRKTGSSRDVAAGPPRAQIAALLALVAAGAVLAPWLVWIHLSLMRRPGAGSVCNFGGYANCDAVNVSRFATVLDVPIAYVEIHRVLKPSGRFFVEEVLRELFLNPIVRRILDHPLEDRFTHERFLRALADTGFHVVGERRLGHTIGWYVADKGETKHVGIGGT